MHCFTSGFQCNPLKRKENPFFSLRDLSLVTSSPKQRLCPITSLLSQLLILLPALDIRLSIEAEYLSASCPDHTNAARRERETVWLEKSFMWKRNRKQIVFSWTWLVPDFQSKCSFAGAGNGSSQLVLLKDERESRNAICPLEEQRENSLGVLPFSCQSCCR